MEEHPRAHQGADAKDDPYHRGPIARQVAGIPFCHALNQQIPENLRSLSVATSGAVHQVLVANGLPIERRHQYSTPQ
jgi:hypothetical protein